MDTIRSDNYIKTLFMSIGKLCDHFFFRFYIISHCCPKTKFCTLFRHTKKHAMKISPMKSNRKLAFLPMLVRICSNESPVIVKDICHRDTDILPFKGVLEMHPSKHLTAGSPYDKREPFIRKVFCFLDNLYAYSVFRKKICKRT